jgi:hypothetical protein
VISVTRSQVVPDEVRAVFLAALQSKHKHALPATLEVGVLYRPHDPSAGGHPATLRLLIGEEEGGLYLDYFTQSQEASSHQRIHADGRVTKLENYEGQFGIRVLPDPAETARERQRVSEHNRRVRDVLRHKGFED